MTQLIPGIYGTGGQEKMGPFGLFWGQQRRPPEDIVIHDAGWYNKLGQRIGCGDLTLADLLWINKEISPDELFIILSKYDSFYKFLQPTIGDMARHYRKHPRRDDKAVAGRNLDSPGMDYLAEYCVLVINYEHIYCTEQHPASGGVVEAFRNSVYLEPLLRKDVQTVLQVSTTS